MTPPTRFEEIVRSHAIELFRYAYWLARDRHLAEDIVQEALLRGWRAYPRLREAAAIKSWLFSIVRNEFLRAAGKAALQTQGMEDLDLADERMGKQELEMRDALMALPAAYAEPLALQVLGGFSCAEIGAMLEITEGAAMTRLTRARQALKRMLAPAPVRARKGERS